MRTSKLIFLTFILSLIWGCNNSELSEKEVETRAKKITQQLNENNIEVFHNWRFEYRGKGEIWTKRRENRNDYQAYYFNENGKQSFMIFPRELKSSEYPILIDMDTSKYHSNIWFSRLDNGKIEISPTLSDTTKLVASDNYYEKDVFGSKNPFEDLKRLSDLKDELEIVSVFHSENLGEFVQFYITYEDVLTYIPDELNINPIYKEHYLEEFKRGEMIKKNWNLRRLENPKKGG